MWHPFRSGRRRSSQPRTARRETAARAAPALEPLEGRTLLSFAAPVTSPGGGNSLAAGDFNNDGRADVAVFANNNKVAVSLGNGDGTFRLTSALGGLAGSPVSITAADVNADGKLDVRAMGFSSNSTTQTKNSGGGVQALGCLQVWPSCGVIPSYGTGHWTTWLGNGDGTFRAATTSSFPWTGWGAPSGPINATSTSADFNRDGALDSASVFGAPNKVSVSLGNADGTYQPGQLYAAGREPGSIAAGDVDGDGWADLIVVNSLSSKRMTFSVLFNDGIW